MRGGEIWIDEARAPQYQHPLRFPDAGQPSALWRAQARVHGLMTQLARRHDLTAVTLVDDEFDVEECRRAMQAYCSEVVLVPNPCVRRAWKCSSTVVSPFGTERHPR